MVFKVKLNKWMVRHQYFIIFFVTFLIYWVFTMINIDKIHGPVSAMVLILGLLLTFQLVAHAIGIAIQEQILNNIKNEKRKI